MITNRVLESGRSKCKPSLRSVDLSEFFCSRVKGQ